MNINQSSESPCALTVKKQERLFLIPILAGFFAAGLLYATLTPAWQAPDEPAHYNYIRQIAENGELPVLEEEDYDHAYLRRLVDQGFPRDLPIATIQYEDHQPPLYYLTAAIVYRLSGGSLIVLRLVNLLFGAGLVILTILVAQIIRPEWKHLPVATSAFVAFLPQHTAMMSAVNNDALAELLVALVLWLSLVLVRQSSRQRKYPVFTGICLGLAMLTKPTAYYAIPVCAFAVWLRFRIARRSEEKVWKSLAPTLLVFGPAITIVLPWWIRNIFVYGWPDILGLLRHSEVVLGQPRTADWISEYGSAAWLERIAVYTFRSFWGQFGWMGVAMDFRVYVGLLFFCGIALLGNSIDWRNKKPLQRTKDKLDSDSMLLLVLLATTVVGYLIYNLFFVQHQGRYLYPALIPIAIFFSRGFHAALQPAKGRHVTFVLTIVTSLLFGFGLLMGDVPGWICAVGLGAAVYVYIASRFGTGFDRVGFYLPFLLLWLVNLYAVFWCIAPQLR